MVFRTDHKKDELGRKRILLCIAVFLAVSVQVFCCVQNNFSVSAKILRAKSLNDLRPDPELNVFPKLLQAIGSDPENDENFEALLHYSTLIDGGAGTYMDRDSFLFFIRENPFLLQQRYIQTGDKRILRFCREIVRGYDPIAFSKDGVSLEGKKRMIETLLQKLQNGGNSERGREFLQNIKEYEKCRSAD